MTQLASLSQGYIASTEGSIIFNDTVHTSVGGIKVASTHKRWQLRLFIDREVRFVGLLRRVSERLLSHRDGCVCLVADCVSSSIMRFAIVKLGNSLSCLSVDFTSLLLLALCRWLS